MDVAGHYSLTFNLCVGGLTTRNCKCALCFEYTRPVECQCPHSPHSQPALWQAVPCQSWPGSRPIMSALLRRSRPSPLCKGICTQCDCLCRCKKCDSSAESGSEDGDGEDTGHHAGLAEIRAILQQRYESSDVDKGKDRDEDSGEDGKAEDGGLAEIRAILQYEYK